MTTKQLPDLDALTKLVESSFSIRSDLSERGNFSTLKQALIQRNGLNWWREECLRTRRCYWERRFETSVLSRKRSLAAPVIAQNRANRVLRSAELKRLRDPRLRIASWLHKMRSGVLGWWIPTFMVPHIRPRTFLVLTRKVNEAREKKLAKERIRDRKRYIKIKQQPERWKAYLKKKYPSPERARARRNRRRCRTENQRVDSDRTIATHLSKCKHTCYWCHARLPKKNWTMDHIIPLAAGGKHACYNIVKACMACNSTKRDLPPNTFIKTGQMLLV